MIRGRIYMLALFVLILSVLFLGCDSDSARDSVRGTAEKAKQNASDAVDKGKQLGRDAFANGQTLFIHGRAWSEHSLAELRDYGARLIDEHGEDLNAAGAKLEELLDRIARDPDTEVTPAARAGRMVVLMIPFAGPTKRFADARVRFDSGLETSDAARLQEARRECLIAFAEAGLDLGSLGLIGVQADVVATGIDRVFTALKVTRSVNALAEGDIVIFDRFLDRLLRSEAIREGIDRALTTDFSAVVPIEQ